MTKLQAQNTIESLSTVLTNAKELFNEMVRLADELNAAKERVADLEKENEELKEEIDNHKRRIQSLESTVERRIAISAGFSEGWVAESEKVAFLEKENDELHNMIDDLQEDFDGSEERCAELEKENERLEEQLQLSQSSVEGMKKSYNGVLHNLQLVYRRELPEAVTTVSNTLKEYSRETGSVLRKGKTSKLADEILIYLRDDDHKWIEAGLHEANIFAAQEKMSNETDTEYELRNRLLRETTDAGVMIGFLRR